MGSFRCLPFVLVILISAGHALLEPELIRWELQGSATEPDNTLRRSNLQKIILEQQSYFKPRRIGSDARANPEGYAVDVQNLVSKILLEQQSHLKPERIGSDARGNPEGNAVHVQNLVSKILLEQQSHLKPERIGSDARANPEGNAIHVQNLVSKILLEQQSHLKPERIGSDFTGPKKEEEANVHPEGNTVNIEKHVSKKALGVFRHGRPSLFFKSGFTSGSESYSGRRRGHSRFTYDRPRPLRWG